MFRVLVLRRNRIALQSATFNITCVSPYHVLAAITVQIARNRPLDSVRYGFSTRCSRRIRISWIDPFSDFMAALPADNCPDGRSYRSTNRAANYSTDYRPCCDTARGTNACTNRVATRLTRDWVAVSIEST